MNPELELLRFLTERGFEHIAALEGYAAYTGRPLETTLALLQHFVPSRGDGWTLALDTIASEPEWLPARARRLGEVTAAAAQRARLRPLRPALRARGAELGGARSALRLDRRGDRAGLRDPAGAGRADAARRPRRGGARPAAAAHAHRQRRQGDPPPRRLPPRPGALDEGRRLADPRLRGRAGAQRARAAAQALAPARRRGDAALVRLRGVGLAAPARGRAAGALGGGVPGGLPCGYLATADAALLPAGEQAIERLLTVFELEKAVYELRYELNNRPDWVEIPVAGILRMLEARADGEARRARPPSRGGRPPRADLRAARRARHRRRRLVRRLGSERTRSSPWSATGTAGTATPTRSSRRARRDLAGVVPRRSRGSAVQVRGRRRRRASFA